MDQGHCAKTGGQNHRGRARLMVPQELSTTPQYQDRLAGRARSLHYRIDARVSSLFDIYLCTCTCIYIVNMVPLNFSNHKEKKRKPPPGPVFWAGVSCSRLKEIIHTYIQFHTSVYRL